ncbi:MAG TPA: hypothetical protein PK629_06505 [Oscillospiraceae bacterium]|nr:hypothetical protein [Oscillospiraceae bacterium]HPF55247.1 hypothetical protein [Clostridiales bacterium]HPK36027.1 hypothetical protein [Oscillospiraceae bacterium]HPR76322.1 hypothetical protein [Oscillospiraceae bacterium]
MNQHYLKIAESLDATYEKSKTKIINDPNHLFNGGYADSYLISETTGAAGILHNLICTYCCKESKYYKNPEVLERINAGCDFILRSTNPDCTINVLISDFHAPATFDLLNIVRAYRIFLKYADQTEAEKETACRVLIVITHHAKGMLVTGFRTPNHRWMEAAALLMTYNILGWPELKAKADKYLAEGIDIDEYGEFTERSAGMYNAVNDNALLTIAEEGKHPEIYEYVERNMDLLFNYIECDGSIFTQNSRRKDKGEGSASGKFFPGHPYYFLYLWAGHTLKNKKYLKFAEEIFNDSVDNNRGAPNAMWVYLLNPELIEWDSEKDLKGIEIPKTYSAFYPLSNIYRRSKEYFSYSIIANNPNFLFVKCGDLNIYVRACASFFAIAQFVPTEVVKTDEGYRMEITAVDDYMLPFETPPATSDWFAMDHSIRKKVCVCTLKITIDFIELENGLKLRVKTEGTEKVPFKLEYVVIPNCKVETENLVMDAHAGEYISLKNGNVRLEHIDKGHTITVKGMFCKHLYHKTLRGSVPQVKDSFTIYSTDFTPIDREVEILCTMRTSTYTDADKI